MARHKMIVINGVRYRPEGAPEPAEVQDGGNPEQQADGGDVQNKARKPATRARGGRRGAAT